MISVLDSLLFTNASASQPISREVNSGRSSHSLPSQSLTLKHNAVAPIEHTLAELE